MVNKFSAKEAKLADDYWNKVIAEVPDNMSGLSAELYDSERSQTEIQRAGRALWIIGYRNSNSSFMTWSKNNYTMFLDNKMIGMKEPTMQSSLAELVEALPALEYLLITYLLLNPDTRSDPSLLSATMCASREYVRSWGDETSVAFDYTAEDGLDIFAVQGWYHHDKVFVIMNYNPVFKELPNVVKECLFVSLAQAPWYHMVIHIFMWRAHLTKASKTTIYEQDYNYYRKQYVQAGTTAQDVRIPRSFCDAAWYVQPSFFLGNGFRYGSAVKNWGGDTPYQKVEDFVKKMAKYSPSFTADDLIIGRASAFLPKEFLGDQLINTYCQYFDIDASWDSDNVWQSSSSAYSEFFSNFGTLIGFNMKQSLNTGFVELNPSDELSDKDSDTESLSMSYRPFSL